MADIYDIKGKVAVITGGATSMGLLAAQNLVALGAKVVIGDISNLGPAAIAEINKSANAHIAIFHHCDVADPAMLHSLIDLAIAEFGQLDILINNAGILDKPWQHDPTGESARRCIDINIRGLIDGTNHALHYWSQDEKRQGVVINLSSLAGHVPMEFMATYAATKAAIAHYTKCLSTLAPKVRINAVAPGGVNTNFILAEHLGLDHFCVTYSGLLEPQTVVDQIIRLIQDTTMAGDVIVIQNNQPPEVCDRPKSSVVEKMLIEIAEANKNKKN
ncbi:hypothetical protein LPJ66_007944 [Kickxella alabastrina]|uniref:Uncharacterized protein n=1 Tax=Kickxella alabastrina TaxID=61397 RepID=A0ACC1IBR5_9FUNG|nr:hypothetical protein LPJ66_007944 [Kickxella alabastrina]